MAKLAIALIWTMALSASALHEETLTFRVHEFPLSRMHNTIFLRNHVQSKSIAIIPLEQEEQERPCRDFHDKAL